MTRVALYLVGSVVVLTLAGCGRSWLSSEQREPWRREAELACLKTGAVKQSDAVVQIKPIEGPGICGAEYPFKVAALGEGAVLGYGGDLRPPAAIPRGFPVPEPRRVQPAATHSYQPQRTYDPPRVYEAPPRAYEPTSIDRPMSIHPPGTDPEEDDTADLDLPGAEPAIPADRSRESFGRPRAPYERPAQSYPPSQTLRRDEPYSDRPASPRLGPDRQPAMSFAGGAAAVQPAATLACPMVSALDNWMANSVQPSAQRWFGQPVVEIKQISAYSCRGMNGQRGAPISEHAFGNALDIAAFTLADGSKVTVKNGWRGSPEEQGFLRDVHASACEQFSTVLAPGSNVYHYDHIHVDLARRRSGRTVCNPAAVSGDLIAQRARDRSSGRLGFAAEEQFKSAIQLKLPRAIPGED